MILFDLPIYQFIMSIFFVNNTILTIMKLITTLGSTLVIVSGILSVAIISWKNKKIFLTFLSANLIGVILNNLIKISSAKEKKELIYKKLLLGVHVLLKH